MDCAFIMGMYMFIFAYMLFAPSLPTVHSVLVMFVGPTMAH
jgi:hypothetical protein